MVTILLDVVFVLCVAAWLIWLVAVTLLLGFVTFGTARMIARILIRKLRSIGNGKDGGVALFPRPTTRWP